MLETAQKCGDIGFYALGGVGNLAYAVSLLQQQVSVPICFLDDDQAAREAASKIVAERLVEEDEIIFAKHRGRIESELEDLYDAETVRAHVLKTFKVDIDLVEKTFNDKKFSDRCRRAFQTAGKSWSDQVKAKVKSSVGALATERGLDIIPEDYRGPITTLQREIEALLDSPLR
jgi:hypothetical protein